jgi:hypothetical protein
VTAVILSASRRTDIPAFFSDWFMERVREGHLTRVNPFNPSQVKEVTLRPDDVAAIVFWSKDPAPLMPRLAELDCAGYRYYFQFTLNDYPALFEPGVPPVQGRIDTFRRLADRLGPSRVVWRYDPIILSSITPSEYHLDRVSSLCDALAGYTCSLVLSFLDFYGKVKGRLAKVGAANGITFIDIAAGSHAVAGAAAQPTSTGECSDGSELHSLARGISEIAGSHRFVVSTCSEKVDLEDVGVRHGACVDAARIRRVLGVPVKTDKDRGQRPECLCAESIDVGTYNTCRHGCVYCYATSAGLDIRL